MRRILIVDDEPNMCTVLKILLENHGYSVATASDGKEAIARIERGEVVDLVVSDLKMPNVDGMGVLNYLKESKRDIPLVLITAYGSIEAAVEAMKMGATDFLEKPADIEALEKKIKDASARRMLIVEKETEDRIKEVIRRAGG